MNFLLKIVEGPMSGAEIALVAGLRVRVGSGADCDIVIADGSLPESAFELDVSDETVSFVCGEETKTLVPFEIFEVGTSGFAIGPAEGAWENLKKSSPVDAESSPHRNETASSADAESSPHRNETSSSADAESSPRQIETPQPKKSHKLLWLLIVLLLFGACAFAVWYFWPAIAAKEDTAVVECHKLTLADIAREHNLTLSTSQLPNAPTSQLLKGNVARRTERMAIRALAQSADPTVKFDLTDDESLAIAANELLFVVTEGLLKVTSASNRVVTLAGYSPSVASLEKTIRALDADVRGIERVVTTAVTVGGNPPPKGETPKAVFADVKPMSKAARSKGTKVDSARDYPIAGILTKPYPAVVMNTGMRLAEGAQLGDAVIERIECDRLVLRKGTTTFEWKP